MKGEEGRETQKEDRRKKYIGPDREKQNESKNERDSLSSSSPA